MRASRKAYGSNCFFHCYIRVPYHRQNFIMLSLRKQVFLFELCTDDECLTLCSKMVKNTHLACSEAFDVQPKDGRPSELVDDAF